MTNGNRVRQVRELRGWSQEELAYRVGIAAEFLLPESAMHREITEPLTMEKLVALKSRWKAAVQALIRRARDIGKINDRSYRYLFERLIANGWKINEPNPIPAEKPRALREMAELVYGKPLNYARMSSDTCIGITRLREVLGARAAEWRDAICRSTREEKQRGQVAIESFQD